MRKSQRVKLGLVVDAYYECKLKHEAIELELFTLKAQLLEAGEERIEGNKAVVTVASFERRTLDSEKVAALLAPEAYAQCERVSHGRQVRVKPKALESTPFVVNAEGGFFSGRTFHERKA